MPAFAKGFLEESVEIIKNLDYEKIEEMVALLAATRKNGGRLFIIGSGGGAGHASHAVCDFRKLCGIEAYAPSDNISELTARVNDEGWEVSTLNWLKTSRFDKRDCVFVFSVGGGNAEKNISPNLVRVVEYAKQICAKVVGVVGKDGGYTNQVGDAVLLIPVINSKHITPHTEGFQALIWHLIVSHPDLQMNPAKWESTK